MLSIIKYIETYGLAEAIQNFKLKSRDYENKILLKYDQLESDYAFEEVQDCRGLILEKGTWRIMCMSFRKFFNVGESHAVAIDWNTANVLEKVDGTMIQLYFDWHKDKWFAATTGTAEGEGEVNNKDGTTFNELFWKTAFEKYSLDIDDLSKTCTYVFELTTPYNIVVKPHGESSLTLLTIRSNSFLTELDYKDLVTIGELIGVPVVKSYDLNKGNFDELVKTFENMPWSEEGYVIMDGAFNRVKIKNPAYVAVHHLKAKTGEHNILTVVKTNEIEEFAATFPERREEIWRLKANYDILLGRLHVAWNELIPHLPKDDGAAEKKAYAMAVFEITKKHSLSQFTNLYFSLKDGKTPSVTQYMLDFDDKTLYKML